MEREGERDSEVNPLPVSTRIPAMARGGVSDGKIVFEQCAGSCGSHACTRDTVFAVASLSKIVVAIVCLRLCESARISLDDDVSKYTRTRGVTVRNPSYPDDVITFRMLLQHRSGLVDHEDGLDIMRNDHGDYVTSLDQVVQERIEGHWGMVRPGDCSYHYSNLGVTVAAWAMECATDTPFTQLASQLVFDPLRMTRTTFMVSESRAFPDTVLAHPHIHSGEIDIYGVGEWPAAGMRSSLNDLLLLLAEMTSPTLLSEQSMKEMFPGSNQRGLAWWGTDCYFRDDGAGEGRWEHGGFMRGVRAYVCVWPQTRCGTVFVQNGEGSMEKKLCLQVREIMKRSLAL
jgi:CubicO group peptidase (beta-lactamase class C family)